MHQCLRADGFTVVDHSLGEGCGVPEAALETDCASAAGATIGGGDSVRGGEVDTEIGGDGGEGSFWLVGVD
jgi:hypothetical protein